MHTPPAIDIDTWRDDPDTDTDIETDDDSEPGIGPVSGVVWFSADRLSVYTATLGARPAQEPGYSWWQPAIEHDGVIGWQASRTPAERPTRREIDEAEERGAVVEVVPDYGPTWRGIVAEVDASGRRRVGGDWFSAAGRIEKRHPWCGAPLMSRVGGAS